MLLDYSLRKYNPLNTHEIATLKRFSGLFARFKAFCCNRLFYKQLERLKYIIVGFETVQRIIPNYKLDLQIVYAT